LCYFHICLPCTLVRFTPPIILPHLPTLLKMTSTGLIVLSLYKYIKYIGCIPPLHSPSTPTSAHPYQDLFYNPVLHFLRASLRTPFVLQSLCVVLRVTGNPRSVSRLPQKFTLGSFLNRKLQ
jgi:hypothetical protein